MPTARAWPKLAFAQRSDAGRDPAKQVNEDASSYAETPLGHLLVVCDGMGGHSAGREASNVAVQTIFGELSRAPVSSPPGEAVRNAIAIAGRRVFALGGGDASPTGRPGSTCVAVLIHPGGTEVAHAGDSRAYLARRGQIWQLTRDHSMVQQMVDAGLLRADEMAGHPEANKITRALGTTPEVDVELRHDPVLQEVGDVFLLVSDGITDVVTDAELLTAATRASETGDVHALCESLVALANARGGPDNATVQAALVLEPGLSTEQVAARAASQTLPGDPPDAALAQPEPRPFRPNVTLPLDAAQLRPKPKPGPAPAAAAAAAPVAPAVAISPAGPASSHVPAVPKGKASADVGTPSHDPAMQPKRALAPTLIDEPVPAAVPRLERVDRRRLAIAAVLFTIGVAIAAASIIALTSDGESPPPLAPPSATPSQSLTAPRPSR